MEASIGSLHNSVMTGVFKAGFTLLPVQFSHCMLEIFNCALMQSVFLLANENQFKVKVASRVACFHA